MALISIIGKSELRFASRLDAEHYSPRFKPILQQLQRTNSLKLRRTLSEPVKTGHTPSTKNENYYRDGIVRFVKTDNLREDRIEIDDVQMLSELGNSRIAASELRPNDVIVTIIGATEEIIGRAARVDSYLGRANINQNIALIRSSVPAGLLAIFLNTRYGREQLIWLSRQTGQVNLNCREVEELSIPRFSGEFVNEIQALNDERHSLLNTSRTAYLEAETTLLSELGLLDWTPKHTLTFVRRYSEVVRAKRADAEYFQPKYDFLLNIIKSNATYCEPLKNFRSFNARGLQPVYMDDGQLRVITSKNILETRLDYDNFDRTDDSKWNTQAAARVYRNDILTYTTGANVGRMNIYLEDEKALASNHVNILRVRDEDPIYMSFVMNSIVGRMQVRQLVTGTAQAELYSSDIDKMMIPFINADAQKIIAASVERSHAAERRARILLERMKHAVEIAVEKGEIKEPFG